jgi:predicted MPP superfamily phosphohydrolase
MSWLLLTAGGACVGGAAYAWRIEPTWLKITRVALPVPNLPVPFHGFNIVQVSDLHLGGRVPETYIASCLARLNSVRPDLVVVTGDLVHRGNTAAAEPAARLLRQVMAPEGVMAILGNHDYGALGPGSGERTVGDRVAEAVSGKGITVLRNARRTIARGGASLNVVGLDELWTNYDPEAAFAGLGEGGRGPCVVLAHNPDAFVDLLGRSYLFDCVLSGHTHGGQVRLPLFGAPFVPVQHKEYVAGLYTEAGKYLYVNRGLGWAVRFRFNARPEITALTLTPA